MGWETLWQTNEILAALRSGETTLEELRGVGKVGMSSAHPAALLFEKVRQWANEPDVAERCGRASFSAQDHGTKWAMTRASLREFANVLEERAKQDIEAWTRCGVSGRR